MPRRSRGDRAEHGDRLAGGGRVEPAAAGDAGVEHRQQVQAGGPHLQPAAVGRRDQRAAVDLRLLHQAGVRQRRTSSRSADPRRRRERQLRLLPGEALPGLDGQQVRAEPVDLREQPGLRGGGQPEDRHDRRRADRDPERGQRGAQRPGAQPDARHPQPVPAQPSRRAHGALAGVGDHPAVEHPDLARQLLGEAAVVGDHDDRGAVGVELAEERHDRRAGGAVEVAGRLVGEDDRRAPDERPGDRDPLALAAGELRWA